MIETGTLGMGLLKNGKTDPGQSKKNASQPEKPPKADKPEKDAAPRNDPPPTATTPEPKATGNDAKTGADLADMRANEKAAHKRSAPKEAPRPEASATPPRVAPGPVAADLDAEEVARAMARKVQADTAIQTIIAAIGATPSKPVAALQSEDTGAKSAADDGYPLARIATADPVEPSVVIRA